MRYFILTILFLAAGIASAATVYDGNLVVDYQGAAPDSLPSNAPQKFLYNAQKNYWLAEAEEGKAPVYRATISLLATGDSDLVYELFQVGTEWTSEIKNSSNWQTVQLPSVSNPENSNALFGIRVKDDINEPQFTFNSYRDGSEYYQTAFTYAGHESVGKSVVDFTTGEYTYNTHTDKTAKFVFGTPLPTPVITLLIALGFGAAFVMYRKHKQVKA